MLKYLFKNTIFNYKKKTEWLFRWTLQKNMEALTSES